MGIVSKAIFSCILLFSSLPMKSENTFSCHLQSIKIIGKTNISSFYFTYNQSQGKNLTQNCVTQSELISFNVPVKSFENRNEQMKEDFYQLLKASSYPEIEVKLDKARLLKVAEDHAIEELPVQIYLAGENQKVSCICYTSTSNNTQFLIEGYTHVRLKDFNLEPPKKMLGAVQVKEKILIKFDVIISSI